MEGRILGKTEGREGRGGIVQVGRGEDT
jgi:hypothetical protein